MPEHNDRTKNQCFQTHAFANMPDGSGVCGLAWLTDLQQGGDSYNLNVIKVSFMTENGLSSVTFAGLLCGAEKSGQ